MNRETLFRVHKFAYDYSLYDWAVVALVLLVGLRIDFSMFPDDFEPNFSTDISQPVRTTTIPYPYLCIVTFGAGALLTVVVWAARRFDRSILHLLAAYYFSVSFTILVTCAVKKLIGRPRPDTAAVCGGSGSYSACIGTITRGAAADQFFSFPSGHAAEAMAPAVFITLLLVETWRSSSMISMSIKFMPIAFALMVAVSRITDRAHHVDDVVVGLFIGGVVGLVTFLTFIQRYQAKDRREGTDSSSVASLSAAGVGAFNKYI